MTLLTLQHHSLNPHQVYNGDTSTNMYDNMSGYETGLTQGSDDEIANEIATAFTAKFKDNSVDSNSLEKMSRSSDARMVMNLPSSKVWIVPMASMTIETFYAMRFMCLSLQEFTDMITFGSINELRQVYSTLNLRTDAHVRMVMHGTDVEYRNTFVHNHPSKFMITSMNPETDTIMTMYDLMKRRIYAYMNASMGRGAVPEHASRPGHSRASEVASVLEGVLDHERGYERGSG